MNLSSSIKHKKSGFFWIVSAGLHEKFKSYFKNHEAQIQTPPLSIYFISKIALKHISKVSLFVFFMNICIILIRQMLSYYSEIIMSLIKMYFCTSGNLRWMATCALDGDLREFALTGHHGGYSR